MELEAFQHSVGRLVDSWADTKPESIMLMLTEEVGELAKAIRKLGRKRWGHEDEIIGSMDDITEELGDVLFLLARVSLLYEVDLEEAATDVLAKIERRLAREG